ncbi:uncharacterized protein LOC134298538 [Anolis carolinensis]|uniref:uncharacterized protein LOC134298538 n=1 Tax=Anolis carolinensis TaxID=28377 RepID=UPI002F2B17F3
MSDSGGWCSSPFLSPRASVVHRHLQGHVAGMTTWSAITFPETPRKWEFQTGNNQGQLIPPNKGFPQVGSSQALKLQGYSMLIKVTNCNIHTCLPQTRVLSPTLDLPQIYKPHLPSFAQTSKPLCLPQMWVKRQERMLLAHGHRARNTYHNSVIPAMKAFDNTTTVSIQVHVAWYGLETCIGGREGANLGPWEQPRTGLAHTPSHPRPLPPHRRAPLGLSRPELRRGGGGGHFPPPSSSSSSASFPLAPSHWLSLPLAEGQKERSLGDLQKLFFLNEKNEEIRKNGLLRFETAISRRVDNQGSILLQNKRK